MDQIHCYGLYDSLFEVDGSARVGVYCLHREARVILTAPSGEKMLVRGRCTSSAKPRWSISVARVDALTPLPDWPVTKMHHRGGGSSTGLAISVPAGTRAEATADPAPLRSAA